MASFVDEEEDPGVGDDNDAGFFMGPRKTLEKPIHCGSCNTVFNATFVVADITRGDERQMGHDVIVEYVCEDSCPKCGEGTDEEITDAYYVDPDGTTAYDYDHNVFSSADYNSCVRDEINKPITCPRCRRRFNVTYTLSESHKLTTANDQVLYECKATECPRCGESISDEIYDSYYFENSATITYERGDYSDEEEVPDNLHDFKREDSSEHNSYNIINESKGDCCVVVVGRSIIVYDFGFAKYFERLKMCLDKIRTNVDIEIVFLVVSHDDSDHIGGLYSLISYLKSLDPPPELFMISPLEKTTFDADNDIKVIGDETDFNGIPLTISLNDKTKLQVVYPKIKHNKQHNNKNSLVAVVFVDGRTIVLTGDQHFHAINMAMENLEIERSTILQFPHHGSLSNFDDYKPIMPSKFYIISGTPVNDGENILCDNYKYNQRCQNNIAKILLSRKTKHCIHLIVTQPRMSSALEKFLSRNNVNIIKVDDVPYFSIALTPSRSRASPTNDTNSQLQKLTLTPK